MTDNKMTPEQMEMCIAELEEQLATIKRVTPYSFRSLSNEDKAERFYLAACECGWWGSSALLEGGGAIADTGDYADPLCPFCGSADIGDKVDPCREVWEQACGKQREICAQAICDEFGIIDDDSNEIARMERALEASRNAPAPEFKLTEKE